MDIAIPGADGEHRSFSMANTPGEPDRLEFMIKLYEGGHFSGLLANGHGIKVGDELTCTGPYGVFTLRDSSPRRLVFIAGGAGMAPIMSLLRSMAEKGTERPATFYYGARTEADLFELEELERLCGELPDLRSSPRSPRRTWDGETGLITDVVDRHGGRPRRGRRLPVRPAADGRRGDRPAGAPGLPESHIYFDKFTTTAD